MKQFRIKLVGKFQKFAEFRDPGVGKFFIFPAAEIQFPDLIKGHVGDVSTVIRIDLTSRKNTPDLYSIMNLLGEDEIKARLAATLKSLT